ncbi:MAG: C-GCAxxG-C-C family protein [Myxococcota bacterium]|nr:C-GCAxxG-C-C family protein [Myxococcota bacterium]
MPKSSGCTRRSFIHRFSPLVVGAFGVPCVANRLVGQEKPGFWAEFSSEEQQVINGSVMAQDILNYAGHGYGCAECSYMVGLRYLGEPEERLGAAAVFSGGFGKGDLCGFLTGGMMAIGVAARKLHEDRSAMSEWARPRRDEFWEWWNSRGPVHCDELREMYEGREEFVRMGQRTAAKLEELIAPAR